MRQQTADDAPWRKTTPSAMGYLKCSQIETEPAFVGPICLAMSFNVGPSSHFRPPSLARSGTSQLDPL